jgi:hypothetical protein
MNAGLLDQSTANGPYRHSKRIIIESGLLYTIVATVTASVYISGSNAFSPLTGIVRRLFFRSQILIPNGRMYK